MRSDTLAIHGGAPVHAGAPIPLSVVSWDEREKAAVDRVFQSGKFCSVYDEALEVKGLEREFAEYVDARHAVVFSSGTTAQHAALFALDIGPGDEVIVPSLTFQSTAYTVLIAGAAPVFADVIRDTILIDPDDIRKKITPRTKAIVPVHWFGHPADMDAIMEIAAERNLAVIEDCCHGPIIRLHGRQVGAFGQIGCWSMQQTKMFTSAGEGGLATTDDDELAARLRQMRSHGKEQVAGATRAATDFIRRYRITALGNNYRLSEMQAAFGRAQLARLDEFRARRRTAYETMRAGLSQIPGLQLQVQQPDVELSYIYMPVLFPAEAFDAEIGELLAAMHAEGVMAHAIGRDELSHVHPLFCEEAGRATAMAYRLRDGAPPPAAGPGTLPVSEKIARELLTLPMHPELSEADVQDIIEATRKVAAAYHR
jgi:perosamine synthetase